MSRQFDYQDAARQAERGPVLAAMRAWMGGAKVLPISEQIRSFGSAYRSYRALWSIGNHDLIDEHKIHKERNLFIREFGFAVPCAEAIDAMVKAGPLIEIGAGSGAWTHLIRAHGGDVIATDPILEQFAFKHGAWAEPLALQGKTAVRRWPERNVLCSWPSLNQTWLRQAARAMRPGRTLFVVREDATAEDSTWEYVESAFRHVDYLELISWQFCHDRFEVWRKLGRQQRKAARNVA